MSNTTWVWAFCALFAAAGALSLLFFGRGRLHRGVLTGAGAVPLLAIFDLVLGPAAIDLPAPLSLVAGAGLSFLVALLPSGSSTIRRAPHAASQESRAAMKNSLTGPDDMDLKPWQQALDLAGEGVLVLDPRDRPVYRNPTWQQKVGPDQEEPLLAFLRPAIERARVDGQAQSVVDRQWLQGLDAEAPHGADTLSPVTATVIGDSRFCTIVLANMESSDLAVVTRQIAHNFNNLLSGIVGGAGMAMDQVAEDSAVYRDLLKIEDTAMLAAELTSELQNAARKVAPPEPHS